MLLINLNCKYACGYRVKAGFTSGLVVLALTVLSACGGNGRSDPVTVAADFSANGVKGTINGQNITIDLSGQGNCSTSVENMVIGIQASGASISPDPRIARDYSLPVQFTLTAPDGTKVVYTVTVKGAECLTSANPPAPPVVPAVVPPVVPPVVPTACTAAAIGNTGYSLVFKGCSAANVAEYYDKTECVRDNATRLIWQGQTTAGTGLRANDQQKSNYDSITASQILVLTAAGDYVSRAPSQAEVDASTNSIGFKNDVNATNLCGSGVWRLPTDDELLGIVKTAEYPAIDNEWFPNTLAQNYWTSSPYLSDAWLAWVAYFGIGYAEPNYRGSYRPVRLVLCNTARCMPG